MTRPKPRARTRVVKVKAWALLCASGKFHRSEHKAHRLFVNEGDAERRGGWFGEIGCGPHRVVPLTGVVTLKQERGK